MNHFSQLAQIDVSKLVDKKQNLSYLSWPHAVNALMEHDPAANWVFHEPKMFGESMMVSCTVTAFGKPITMHLPVMDHRNQAVKNPDAVVVNKNMMRCLVKAIACHGLGLSVYAGEDLPSFPDPDTGEVPAPKPEPKPEPKAEKPPKEIAGKAGEWQIKIKMLDDDADEHAWYAMVVESVEVLLKTATSEADVMAVFRNNTPIMNRVKQMTGPAYNDLLEVFKLYKSKFTKKDEE